MSAERALKNPSVDTSLRTGALSAHRAPGRMRLGARLSVAVVASFPSPSQAWILMLTSISMNGLASTWHPAQMKTSPASL